MRVKGLYRGAQPVARGGAPVGGPPCRPSGGDRPPVARGWGDRPPLHPRTPGQGPICKLEGKKYKQVLSPFGQATGVYFRNFSKPTYIFVKSLHVASMAQQYDRIAHSDISSDAACYNNNYS